MLTLVSNNGSSIEKKETGTNKVQDNISKKLTPELATSQLVTKYRKILLDIYSAPCFSHINPVGFSIDDIYSDVHKMNQEELFYLIGKVTSMVESIQKQKEIETNKERTYLKLLEALTIRYNNSKK